MEEKKVVLITGGAMGQGRAHAYKYAENGFNVVLADMLEPSHEAFKETIANCEAKGAKVLAKKANITSTEDMEALFASAWETFGRLDVVIANAGVINFGYTWELTDEQVEKVMDINLIGTWRTDKYAAQYMLKQGFGRIINISSTNGINTYYPMCIDYDASKAALISLTHNLAFEYGPYINVNAIAPGFIGTDNELDGYDEEFLKEEQEKIMVNRYGKPEEVAYLVKFLISDEANFINNTIIRIDGGQKGSC